MQRERRGDFDNVRGAVLWQSGHLDGAIDAFRTALERDPGHAEAARNLGNALREAGRLDEAISHFRLAIDIDPRDGRAHRYLVETRLDYDPVHAHNMEVTLSDPNVDRINRIELHFALATAYDRGGLWEQSFAHLHRANRLKRETLTYRESDERTLLELLRQTFNRDVVRAMRGCGNPSPLPIFIVGMPRSGTTLVEQLLAAHPDVHAAGELTAFENAFAEFRAPTADARNPSAFARELASELRELGTRYVEGIGTLARTSALRVTDKMPSNYRFAIPIHLALPRAKIVHVRRDPLDACLSCYSTNFLDGQLYSYDLTELGRYYCLYDKHMRYVRDLLPPDVLLDVDYEDLVDDFTTHARRIVEHCALPWDAACIEFWRAERPVRTASVVQVRRPLFTSSVGRAQVHLARLAPLVAALSTNGA